LCYPECCYNQEIGDYIDKVINEIQAAPVHRGTGPGSRLGDYGDKSTLLYYSGTGSEYSAAPSASSIANERNYDTDNDQVDLFTSVVVDDLEDVVFVDTALHALIEKENNVRKKKVNKYYRCKKRYSKLFE